MKIGIITYFDVTNYGAALLAYSMQKTLASLGHEVVFLKYKRENEHLNAKKNLYSRLRGLSPNAIKARKAEEKKIKVFADFRNKNLTVGDYYDVPQGLDLIIVGSDQIFDCKYEFNDYQFAIGAPCKKVISYAPSFGEFRFADLDSFEKKEELKTALNAFKAHSARDENTYRILQAITQKAPVRVVDPTILYGFEKEKQAWSERIVKEKYLIVYTWGGNTGSDAFQNAVTEFAQKNALKTVSVGDRRPWCDYDYASASPEEFFALYRHCDMVITNMFHGTCFAIINEKPFYSCVMPHNKNKLSDLLFFFDLKEQMVEDIGVISELKVPKIDYSCVNALVQKQREISKKYIEDHVV